MKYRIEGAGRVSEKQTIDKEVTFWVTAEGTSIVKAYTYIIGDEGETSEEVEQDVRIDTEIPGAPIITVNGTRGDDENWYRSDMTVTIEGGRDTASGAAKIKYKVEGAHVVEERTISKSTVQLTIKEEGTSTITAWTIDGAGRQSEENYPATRTVSKDAVAPTAGLSIGSTLSTMITANATGQDDRSGIYSYIYMYKKSTDSTYKQVATVTSEEETNSYTIKNLTGNTLYDIKVVVRDKAGNEGEAVTQSIKTNVQVKVGDYVAYTPTPGTYNTGTDGVSAGPTTNQVFQTETNLGWRVWSIDEENKSLILIANNPTSTQLKLQGANGFNNGVRTLNIICNNCYSNESIGATGRSINYLDIDGRLNKNVFNPSNVPIYVSGSLAYNFGENMYASGCVHIPQRLVVSRRVLHR